MASDPVVIEVTRTQTVSGLLQAPANASACYVLAHGAGAGINHPFMAASADGLARRGIATLRFQFPYMENGSKRPDSPALAHATIRAAVAATFRLLPGCPLFAGGKSFGARMTSQAQADAPLASVRGLVFLGFPLHPAKKPSTERARHLSAVHVPMLFVQGTRDALAEIPLLLPTVDALGPAATLKLLDHADHSFHVPARSGKTDAAVLDEALDKVLAWMQAVIAHST